MSTEDNILAGDRQQTALPSVKQPSYAEHNSTEPGKTPAVVLPFPTPSQPKSAKLPPGRRTDAEHGRTRSHLTPGEVKSMLKAARATGRHGHRDSTLILIAFRHGLRVSELISLRWDAVHFDEATLAVKRLKNGTPSTHPLTGDELRALRRLKRESDSRFVFTSERGSPLSVSAARAVIRRSGEVAKIGFQVTPHMLRHACGYALANKGVDTRSLQSYLGHRSIQNTVRYSELSANRFNNFWED